MNSNIFQIRHKKGQQEYEKESGKHKSKPRDTISHLLEPLPSKRQRIISVCEDVEKKESLCTVSGMQTGTATMENSVEVPQKIKNTAII